MSNVPCVIRWAFCACLLLLVGPTPVEAQLRGESEIRATGRTPCSGERAYDACEPTQNQLVSLCNQVSAKAHDESSDHFMFGYEHVLWAMAGAMPGVDSDSAAIGKVRMFWQKYASRLMCNTSRKNAHVLAVAVHSSFPEMVEELAQFYGVDISVVDPVNGGTVLDYIAKEIDMYVATGRPDASEREWLRGIYSSFKDRLGARHATQVKNHPPDEYL